MIQWAPDYTTVVQFVLPPIKPIVYREVSSNENLVELHYTLYGLLRHFGAIPEYARDISSSLTSEIA